MLLLEFRLLEGVMDWIVFPKKMCWNPSLQVLQNVTFFENRVFANMMKLKEVIRVGPDPLGWCPLKGEELIKTETNQEGDNEAVEADCSDADTGCKDKGLPRSTRSCENH